jgi:hypothetical protein
VNEALEHLEDVASALDIDLAHNASVLRLFLANGGRAGYQSAIVQLELVAIYGQPGGLMVPLILAHPDIVYPRILKRVRERAVELKVRKLRVTEEWAMQLERALPAHTAKYQTVDLFARFALPTMGREPLRFSVELTRIIGGFFQCLCTAWRGPDTESAAER